MRSAFEKHSAPPHSNPTPPPVVLALDCRSEYFLGKRHRDHLLAHSQSYASFLISDADYGISWENRRKRRLEDREG